MRMIAEPTLPKYVHLKVHSAYSLLEGALPIARIAKLSETAAMPAVGLTDTNNLFGALEFSEKLAGSGIQPIVGCALAVDFDDSAKTFAGHTFAGHAFAGGQKGPKKDGMLTLITMNEHGYANLMKLVSRAHLN